MNFIKSIKNINLEAIQTIKNKEKLYLEDEDTIIHFYNGKYTANLIFAGRMFISSDLGKLLVKINDYFY